ncbi:MAG TPA: L-serine ammonia-lyase, iron-sulfur-dependent, subunit alpha [Clostridia bacterium]|nr:L-serine ammonia-lyase, iron-sulfur-dependent, subunit alpha [Clostridia bacterium]
MKSIRELFKIGRGPSSSHTMGPEKAAKLFIKEYPKADSFSVTLYGSLAKTGKGHGTDTVLKKTFVLPTEVIFDETTEVAHPNTFDMYAFKDGVKLGKWRVRSIGGGEIKILGKKTEQSPEVYPIKHFKEIATYCLFKEIRLSDFVEEYEGSEIWNYLQIVWNSMKNTIREGLNATGILPGGLNISRKAKLLFGQKHIDESAVTKEHRLVCSYAYATSEQNASGETVVTAPTCGASGVLPAVLKYVQDKHHFSDDKILRGLAAAGLIGNIVKTNASISGAECGCQAEIGTACSMAAAALAEIFEMEIDQIEYAAEMPLEHHLGLTCDPVCGLVQIPCIERNAVAAMRAINAFSLANFLTNTRKVSLDIIIQTMYRTGKDMRAIYRETGKGGLAKLYVSND